MASTRRCVANDGYVTPAVLMARPPHRHSSRSALLVRILTTALSLTACGGGSAYLDASYGYGGELDTSVPYPPDSWSPPPSWRGESDEALLGVCLWQLAESEQEARATQAHYCELAVDALTRDTLGVESTPLPFDPCEHLLDTENAESDGALCSLEEERTGSESRRSNMTLDAANGTVRGFVRWVGADEVAPTVVPRAHGSRRYSFSFLAPDISYDRQIFGLQLTRCGTQCWDAEPAVAKGNLAHELGHWAEGHPERSGQTLLSFCRGFGDRIVTESDGPPSEPLWRELYADFYAGRLIAVSHDRQELAHFFSRLDVPLQGGEHPPARLRRSAIEVGGAEGEHARAATESIQYLRWLEVNLAAFRIEEAEPDATGTEGGDVDSSASPATSTPAPSPTEASDAP